MAWRFKASKYKNAAPIVPKPETCIRDICVGSYQTFGNNICASAAFMAFNWEHVGSSLAVLPLDDCGRKSKTMPLLHAHSDTVTDMEFSPFHDGLLLTGSQDSLVKVWHIPPEGLKESLSTPECTLSQKQRRVENVGFHPVADGLIHVASGHELALWDLTKQKEAFVHKEHTDVIQSTCWKKTGDLIATSCKDKLVRIIDPRSNTVQSASSHQNIKDSRVACLSENRLLTTGFDAARLRQVILRDMRNLSTPLKTLELDCSTGVLMPLYDHDTNMLFLAGKGDMTIMYMELADREPFLLDGLRHSGEQTKGACLVPKRALRVMEGEVNRILQLTGSSVIPIMYQVPRKSYRDYHADLYPDTAGCMTYLNAPMWLENQDYPVPNISLHPDANNCITVHRGNLESVVKEILAMPVPKKVDGKKVVTPHIEEAPKPVIQAKIDDNDEDRIDFVNVKDLIKGMEKQKPKPVDYSKETNGFHKKPTENGHDMEKIENGDKSPKATEKISVIDEKTTTIEQSETKSDNTNVKSDNTTIKSDNTTIKSDNTTIKSDNTTIKSYNTTAKSDNTTIKSDNAIDTSDNDIKSEKSFEKTDSSDSSETLLSRSNSLINGAPPKPLPRSSISESGSDDVEVPKPRPRTTATATTGYKPRLGPKPFSASTGSEEFSFDKVFSVPAVPGITKSESATSPIGPSSTTPVTSTPIMKEDDKEKSLSPTSDNETINKEEYTNGKSDTSLEEDVNSSDSGYIPKTPSTTAERRKLFEGNNVTDGNTQSTSPKNSQSIADRKRAYEMRSLSVAVESETPPSPAPLRRRDSLKTRKSPEREDKRASVPNVTTKRTSTVFGKVSKFRHLKGTPAHKSTHVENIKNVSRQISGECNGFYANGIRCAVPVTGGGGRIAVVELPTLATCISRAPHPHPGISPPSLLHAAPLQDWTFDPFCDERILVACDDGMIREWILPEDGLKESTNTPNRTFSAHPDKIYIVRFHPTANNIVTTAAHDLTVKLWDLTPDTPVNCITLTGHTDQIFALDWSPCGKFLATVCRDGLIRIFDPRKSCEAIRSGKGPVGTRGARIVWALNGTHLVVTGFDKVSERQIMVYSSTQLSAPLCTVGLDVSPAILHIHIDHDSATLFLTGRGDSTIYCYEVTSEPPYLCALSHHRSPTLHQGIAFLHKNLVAVDKVEFARALRLTNGNIEPLSFTVPRIKSELFQDDLFPPTLVTWSPWQTAQQWLNNEKVEPRTVSLQPEGMECLSAHTTPPPVIKEATKNTQKNLKSEIKPLGEIGVKDKQDNIMKSISAKVQINLKLEQDTMEGVDEAEWEQ